MDTTLGDWLATVTGGRPYVFVIMAFKSKWDLYERIEKIAKQEFGVECIRADHVKASGHDLLAKIHLLIERAELVIAEISTDSPNVFYEIGYAVAVQKRPILLIEKGEEVPTDLKGLEVVGYDGSQQGTMLLEAELTEHIRQHMSWEVSLLRDMLQAPRPEPAYIVASPKYAQKHRSRYEATGGYVTGQRDDVRTFGDNLGIRGLISAFGLMMGEGRAVELISAQYCPQDLDGHSLNLYLIGSRKVNPLAGKLLAQLQKNQDVKWSLDPLEGHTEEEENWPVCLYRTIAGEKQAVPGTITTGLTRDHISLWTEDYGVVVRAPHPEHPDDRLLLIMAGAHSLGTGAACLAATRSPLIRQIKVALPDGVLEDKKTAFWALVKGTASPDDYLLDVEGVSIEDAGVYE
jgi:hypothetical protein